MNETLGTHAGQQLRFLQDLEDENAWISPDIIPVGYGIWAIHGVIAVDGNVLMAEFWSYDDARRVLDRLHDSP
jgi:hypothetical protein